MSMLLDQMKENAGFYIQLPSVGRILFLTSILEQDRCALHCMGLAMSREPMELGQQTQTFCCLLGLKVYEITLHLPGTNPDNYVYSHLLHAQLCSC